MIYFFPIFFTLSVVVALQRAEVQHMSVEGSSVVQVFEVYEAYIDGNFLYTSYYRLKPIYTYLEGLGVLGLLGVNGLAAGLSTNFLADDPTLFSVGVVSIDVLLPLLVELCTDA